MDLFGEQCKIIYADTDSVMVIFPGPVEQNGNPVQPVCFTDKTEKKEDEEKYNKILK